MILSAKTAEFIRIDVVIFLHFEEIQSIISEHIISASVRRKYSISIYCRTVILIGKSAKSIILFMEAFRPLRS